MLLMLFPILACTGVPDRVATGDGPNIVLVVCDTLSRSHMSTYGYERDTMPNLTAFADTAVRFDKSISHAPWTKPSHASLFTSMEPAFTGVTKWESTVDPTLPTLAGALSDAGYWTEAWVSHDAFDRKDGNEFHQGFDYFDHSVYGNDEPHLISTAKDITDLALTALDELPEPYFLWVHYFDPHNQYLEQEENDFGSARVDLYDGEIAHTDKHLGRLLDALDTEDTIVVFTVDHGEEFGEHGQLLHGKSLYQELINVGLIIKAPGVEPGVNDEPVRHIDIAPTLLDWVGVEAPPTFRGEPLVIEDGAITAPGWRPAFLETRNALQLRGVFDWPYKLVRNLEDDTTKLFDVDSDPKELTDIAADEPEIVEQLDEMLDEHLDEAGR